MRHCLEAGGWIAHFYKFTLLEHRATGQHNIVNPGQQGCQLIVRAIGIREIHQEGIGIFLVEQNANLAFDLVESLYVLEVGKITVQGRAEKLMNDEQVRHAFLGG